MDKYIKLEDAFDIMTNLARKASTRSAYEAVWKSARALEKLPAADVSPIVHGQFVHIGPRFAHGVDWWKCSICGSLVSGSETQFSYCPHCGAKMGGGNQNV